MGFVQFKTVHETKSTRDFSLFILLCKATHGFIFFMRFNGLKQMCMIAFFDPNYV